MLLILRSHQKRNFMNIANIYKKVLLVNKFEDKVIQYIKEGKIIYPVYLSKGQEVVAAILSELCNGWNIFAQHRAHDLYLCFGGNPKKLMDELLGLPTGLSKGMAGSNCIHDLDINMWGHHGLIGENVPIATGFAFGSNKPTLCVFGDGAAEEDYIGPSFGFSTMHKLPILYVCLDNNLSVLTPKESRRKWRLVDVASAYGMEMVGNKTDNHEMKDINIVRLYELIQNIINFNFLPTLLNIFVCRKHWHVGTGIDNEPNWNTFESFQKYKLDFTRINNEVDELLEGI
jgi:acetoin:2,6-dichlorophenolindophenol oxidoreductase subunit alpha